ncbi:MAG: thiolase family protein [Dehalococcoidia bacterium]
MDWKGRVGIFGIGEAGVGRAHGKSAFMIQAEAIDNALNEAGISLDEVDGIVNPNSLSDPRLRYAQSVAEYIGMSADKLRFVQTDPLGGSASGQSIHHAVMSIISGYASVVVVCGGDVLRSASGASSQGAQNQMADVMGKEFENPYGLSPVAFFALMARKYMVDYGVTPETMAGVAVALRAYAATTPGAHLFGRPVSVADVMESPMIADPIHRLECALISDGACALILASAEARTKFKKAPVLVDAASIAYGSGSGKVHEHMSQAVDLYTPRSSARVSSRRALADAGLSLRDVDVLFAYDAFPVLPSLLIEGLGYAEDGRGADFIASGNIALDGTIPMNTHGGLQGYCHSGYNGGMFMFTEAVRQLRGEAHNQVSDAHIALVQGYGSHISRFPTTILRSE